MIPQFPVFKRIEIADLKEVEQFTNQFQPYSDYNFISLWSWNIDNAICLSKLNENLIVRFTDYLTGKPFYSFLGTTNVNDTAHKLLELSIKEGLEPVLKLLPAVSIMDIDTTCFTIIEDRGGFDYIYDINTFLTMGSPKFHEKRKQCKSFEKSHPHIVMELDITHPLIKDQIIDLCHDWVKIKIDKGGAEHFQNEFLSLLRYLNGVSRKDHVTIGVFAHNRLIAVSISENTVNKYNICHFQKIIPTLYKGLNVYLARAVAKILAAKGIKYINWEQDLGIPGLRESKESYQPCTFLKKYSLSTV